MYMPITVWQVFFGFQVLFTTLITVTYRKQQLFIVDWLDLFVSVLGMSIAGVDGLLRNMGKSENGKVDTFINTIFFMFILAIISHAVECLETILEEKIMHENGVTGAHMTAFEGIWGLFLLTFICLPICNSLPTASLGIYENSMDSFVQLKVSIPLRITVVLYPIFFTIFSYSDFLVTEPSTAIHMNLYMKFYCAFG